MRPIVRHRGVGRGKRDFLALGGILVENLGNSVVSVQVFPSSTQKKNGMHGERILQKSEKIAQKSSLCHSSFSPFFPHTLSSLSIIFKAMSPSKLLFFLAKDRERALNEPMW